MSIVKTAVFPVAGLGTRFLPATKAMPKEMLPIVDRPLIQFVVQEARECNIERLIFVTGRQKHSIENHFDHMYELERNLEEKENHAALQSVTESLGMPGEILFTRQMAPKGLGHAVWCARHVIQRDPFAVLLADDFIDAEPGCLKQMIDAYTRQAGNYLAAMEVPIESVGKYGVVEPISKNAVQADPRCISLQGIIEKPSREQAPSNLAVVGRYVLNASVLQHLDKHHIGAGGEIQLTDAIAADMQTTPTYAFKYQGKRFDCGSRRGFVEAVAHVAKKLELS